MNWIDSHSRVEEGVTVEGCNTERESLWAQTLNHFMQIKVQALGHRKKTVIHAVSSGAPRQFHKFLLWFKVDGRIIANLIRLYFLKRLQSVSTS